MKFNNVNESPVFFWHSSKNLKLERLADNKYELHNVATDVYG